MILFQDTATGANGTDIGTRGYAPGGGGFTSIQGNEYELTWGGAGVWRGRYNTVIADDGFHLWSKVRRPSVAAISHWTGIMFWYREGATVEFCYLYMLRMTDATVRISFHRYDGATQDPAILLSSLALAAGAQIRLGVRMVSGVATAYWAQPDGSLEVDLGVLTTSVDWRDGNHRMIGIGNNQAGSAQGSKWDDITVEDFSTNWTPPDPPIGLTAWGDCK